MSGRWAGTRFDGRSAAGEIVALTVDASTLVIVSRAGCERHALAALAIAETFRHAPVMIGLPEGATLEVPDPGRTLHAALAAAGHRPPMVVRLQERWPAALAALVVLIGTLALAYAVGLPLAARAIVAAMPADMERRLGEGVLDTMDRHTLRSSGLAPARRKAIESTFAQAAARTAPGVEARLAFRAGPPNAFALPGGTIVVLDGLVQLAATDDELVAALGHELGHVVHKHSTRQLVQGLGVVALASLLWGEFSSVAANGPALLGIMRYGRAFEHEADAFALALLQAEGRSPHALDALFARMDEARKDRGSIPDFLSTHPSTDERRRRLGEARTQSPAPASAR